MLAFLIASVFGSYGWIAFTYIGITAAWLTASILEHQPWYVPPTAVAEPAKPFARR